MTMGTMEKKIRLIEKALAALEPHLSHCRLCPRECGTDRSRARTGSRTSPCLSWKVNTNLGPMNKLTCSALTV